MSNRDDVNVFELTKDRKIVAKGSIDPETLKENGVILWKWNKKKRESKLSDLVMIRGDVWFTLPTNSDSDREYQIATFVPKENVQMELLSVLLEMSEKS